MTGLRLKWMQVVSLIAVAVLTCSVGCQMPPPPGRVQTAALKLPVPGVPPKPAAAPFKEAQQAGKPAASTPPTQVMANAPAAPTSKVAVAPTPPAPVPPLPGKPIVYSNIQGFYADEEMSLLSEDVKELMKMVDSVNAAVTGKTMVVEKIVEKIVEKPMDTKAMLGKLGEMMTGDITGRRSGLKPYMAKASLCLISPDCELKEEDLAMLNEEDLAIVEEYQALFKQLGQQLGSADRKADREALMASAERLSKSLSAQKQIEIAQAWLCKGVNGFGTYEAFEKNEFRLGEMPKILVYTEIENYKSQRRADGQYAVNLLQELSLYKEGDGEGAPVWSEQAVQIADLSRNIRRDFFLVQYLRLPDTLAPGEYKLHIKVTDLTSGGSSVAKVPLQLAGKK